MTSVVLSKPSRYLLDFCDFSHPLIIPPNRLWLSEESVGNDANSQLHESRGRYSTSDILVVDDCSSTQRILSGVLSEVFGNCVSASCSLDAENLIRQRWEGGLPLHGIILDLNLGGKSGLELIRSFLDPDGYLFDIPMPGIVLATASMMALDVAQITSASQSFRIFKNDSGLEKSQIDSCVNSDNLSMSPNPEVFVHFKGEPYPNLINKMARAIELSRQCPESVKDFWRNFKPAVYPTNFSQQTVHDVAELVRNFCEEFCGLWIQMQSDTELSEEVNTALGNQASAELSVALNRLVKLSYTVLYSDNRAETKDNVHDALNLVAKCDPHLVRGGGLNRSQKFKGLLENWHEIFREYNERLNELYEGLRAQSSPNLDMKRFCSSLGHNVKLSLPYRSSDSEFKLPHLPDPEFKIRNFLRKLVEHFRSLQNDKLPELSLRIEFWPEVPLKFHGDGNLIEVLEEKGFGDVFKVNLSWETSELSADEVFRPVLAALPELIREKLIHIEVSSSPNDFQQNGRVGSSVAVYIKASEQSTTLRDYLETSQKKQPDGSFYLFIEGQQFHVIEDIGENGDIVALNGKPGEGIMLSPLVFDYGGMKIYSQLHSHRESAWLVKEYLKYREGLEQPIAGLPVPSIDTIDDLSVRLRTFHDAVCILSAAPWIRNVLRELGVADENIK